MSSVESILADAQELSPVERYELAMALLETLREPIGAPKAKRSKAASAEPKTTRAPTSWNTGCAAVRAAIKGVEGYKPPHVMAFASFLKKADEAGWAALEAEVFVTKYEAWLVDNSDVGSRSSGGSKAAKAPKAEPTEEEKAAKRKLAAEKRKATMAAKKAAAAAAEESEEEVAPAPKAAKESKKAVAAAEAAAVAAVAEAEELEEEEIAMTAWEHDFGDGAKTYARYEKDGKVYLYETDGQTYIGEVQGKKKLKLVTSTADPLA